MMLVLSSCLIATIHGFQPSPMLTSKSITTTNTPPSSLHATSGDRVKKAGCGIPIISDGECKLFDPEEEGKLQGTGSISSRIHNAANYVLPHDVTIAPGGMGVNTVVEPPSHVSVLNAQHWLEHLTDGDGKNLPLNFAKPNNPTVATLLARTRIISDDAEGDIQHIIMRLPEGMHYVEGQSLSVIPEGVDPKTNKKYKPRLYSIASTRYGDVLDGNTISLCVRRAEHYDPVTKQIDESKKGVCSNYLCDALPGTQISVAGPVGKTMLLPKDNNDDIIMIATGTGIAPFRGFLHRLFMEETVARHMFGGTAWLVLGVPTTGGLLYKEEIDAMIQNGKGQFKVDYAISREMSNDIDGGRTYVQHIIAKNANEFFDRLDNGASAYFCGLKGMMPGILETLEKVASDKGLDWNTKLKQWKDNHQWHVEVY
jgi:ferredoxin--NADP+ reductase